MLTRPQVLLLRVSGACAIGFLLYLGFLILSWRVAPGRGPSKVQTRSSPGAVAEPGFRSVNSGSLAMSRELLDNTTRLTRLLRRYVRARPLDRGRIVHKIRLRLDDYEGLIIRILHEDHESVLIPACLVAGRLKLNGGPHELYRLTQTGEPEVQAAAIRGLILYGFWTRSLVAALLKREESIVLVAALEAAGVIGNPPVPEMLELLLHQDPNVRKAAIDAMPPELDPQDLERLRAITATANGPRAHAAIELLGSLAAGAQRDAALLARLETRSWTTRQRCLVALAKGDSPLKYAEPVWRAIRRDDSVDRGDEFLPFCKLVFVVETENRLWNIPIIRAAEFT